MPQLPDFTHTLQGDPPFGQMRVALPSQDSGALVGVLEFPIKGNLGAHCLTHSFWRRCSTEKEAANAANYSSTWCVGCAVMATEQQPKSAPKRRGRRRFGIEIEGYSKLSQYDIANLLCEAGIEAEESWEHSDTAWVIKDDCSIRAPGHYYYQIEIASPPLKWPSGMEQVRTVCDVLQNAGFKTNSSCGLHVHVECQRHSLATLKRFVWSWQNNYEQISAMLPHHRRGEKEYIGPFRSYELTSIEMATSKDYLAGCADRYNSVNLDALAKFGTIEIRQHDSTLEAAVIESWIEMIQRMLDTAASSNKPLDTSETGLRGFLDSLQMEHADRLFERAEKRRNSRKVLYGIHA